MNSNPLVSIVIPVYNVEQYLRQCLDSVVHQTYDNLEIVCVNDGSPDNSIDILREYERKDQRVKVVDIENQGLSEARNVGTANCNGDFLLYIDSDDWIDLETVESSLRAVQEHDSDLVLWNYIKEYDGYSRPVLVFHEKSVFEEEGFVQLYQRLVGLTGEQLRHPEQCDSISTAWGKLYRLSVIRDNNIKFVNTRIIGTEDLLFNAEVFKYCSSAVALPERFNHYRKSNASSLTKNFKPEFFEQSLELQRRLRSVCGDVDFLSQSLSNRTALTMIGLGLRVVSSKGTLFQKAKRIRDIITTTSYKDAFQSLEMQYLPLHWKVFFNCAKYRLSFVLLILLQVMRRAIRGYKNRN